MSSLLSTISAFWNESLGPGWIDSSESNASEIRNGELLLRGAKYVYYCPGCGTSGDAQGAHVVCCNLLITPYYIVREMRLRLDALRNQELSRIGDAVHRAATSGGTVSGGTIEERGLGAPKRVFP